MLLRCTRLKKGLCKKCFCSQKMLDQQGGCQSNINVPQVNTLLNKLGELKTNQDKYIEEVRETIKKREAVLVLGAGISIPAGMPDWRTLISRMVGYAMQYEAYVSDETWHSPGMKVEMELAKTMILEKIPILESTNVLEAGQYIQQALTFDGRRSREELELMKEIISSIIEKSRTPKQMLEEYCQKKGIGDVSKLDIADPQIEQAVAKDNTLFSVTYLLKKCFNCAITYNYDSLVQECLFDVFEQDEDSVITHPGQWVKDDKDSINIFHVHGFIPRKSREEKGKAFPKESKQIILSEESYYNMEQFSAYGWQNSIQSYYLNKNHCLFVGFSADDYNFRRILRNLGKGEEVQKKHYLILSIDGLVRETWQSVCQHHIKSRKTSEEIEQDTFLLLKKELEMKEKYWAKYKFYPIWVTIQDIPKLLVSFAV